MKIYFPFIIVFIFFTNVFCMCKGNTSDTKEREVLIGDSIVLDSTTIMSFSADSLIKRNGSPSSDIQFQMKETNRDKKVLRDFFPYDSNIEIRELKWNIDSENFFLIWYVKKENEWKPITYSVRSIYQE